MTDFPVPRRTLLAGTAAALAAPAFGASAWTAPAPRSRAFPEGFLWGAATAGHQIEGNNVNADTWALEHANQTTFKEPSGDAANSFMLWKTDLDLARNMGLNTYRFSLEWARIEPERGAWSIAMLDHYKAVIEGCRARALTPFVTFNHYTVPRWFAVAGGWANPQAPGNFARFCERATRHFGDAIGYATTLNEPNLNGQISVLFPPDLVEGALAADRAMIEAAGRASGAPGFSPGNALWQADPERAQANMREAHRLARLAIKSVRPQLPVGVSLAIIDDQAAGPGSMRDTIRAKLYAPWLEAARDNDFIGVQNYERAVWGRSGKLPPPPGAPVNDGGGEIYPASLAGAARYAHAVSGIPVIVTEHGINAKDDALRTRLIPAALAELKRAMEGGVPVLGYIHWSLMDNFEWGSGYGPKFGLHSFDRTTFVRTPKPSAAVLGAIAHNNAI